MKLSKPIVMTVSKMNSLLKKLGNNSLIKEEAVSTTFLQLLVTNAGYGNYFFQQIIEYEILGEGSQICHYCLRRKGLKSQLLAGEGSQISLF